MEALDAFAYERKASEARQPTQSGGVLGQVPNKTQTTACQHNKQLTKPVVENVPRLNLWERLRFSQSKTMWNPQLTKAGMTDTNQRNYRSCACWVVGTDESPQLSVRVNPDGRAYYRGLNSCYRHSCPRCGTRIRAAYAKQIETVLNGAVQAGKKIIYCVLTIPHTRYTSPKESLDILQKIHAVAFHQAVRKNHYVEDYIKTVDHTVGRKHGHHYHSNYALIVPGDYDIYDLHNLRFDVFDRMRRVCEKRGLGTPLFEFQYFEFVDNVKVISEYISKCREMVREYLGNEMLNSSSKNAKSGHYNPAELLDLAASGDLWAQAMRREYEAAMYKRRIISWSRGLKKKYEDLSKTDEEIVKAEEEKEDDEILSINDPAFEAIKAAGVEANVLRVTESFVKKTSLWMVDKFQQLKGLLAGIDTGFFSIEKGSNMLRILIGGFTNVEED